MPTFGRWKRSHAPSGRCFSPLRRASGRPRGGNLTAGARQLALAEIGQSTSPNAEIVTANVRTMEAALRLADHLGERAILELHQELLSAQPGRQGHAGHDRDQLVWVGASAISPRGAAHLGAQAALVPIAMEDLTAFVQREHMQVIAARRLRGQPATELIDARWAFPGTRWTWPREDDTVWIF